jgi:hypothetical protein
MELPPSLVDKDDYPSGPTGMARYLEARLDEMEGQKRECRFRDERRPINQQMHQLKDLLRWCKTREGYDPQADVSGYRTLPGSVFHEATSSPGASISPSSLKPNSASEV